MPTFYEPYRWEKPFLVLQSGMNQLMLQFERLPGIVQLAFYLVVLAVSLLNIPFVLTHWLIGMVVEYFKPREIPLLSRGELLEFANHLHTRWTSRHRTMIECNPRELADDIALPVINTLAELILELTEDDFNHGRVEQIANQLIDIPVRTAPDAQLLGKIVKRHLRPERVECFAKAIHRKHNQRLNSKIDPLMNTATTNTSPIRVPQIAISCVPPMPVCFLRFRSTIERRISTAVNSAANAMTKTTVDAPQFITLPAS